MCSLLKGDKFQFEYKNNMSNLNLLRFEMNEVKASNLHLSECNKALFETNEKLSKRNKDLDVVIETNKDNMRKWEKLRV
jgi:hypothetical protein